MARNKKPKKRYRPQPREASPMLKELAARAVIDFSETVDEASRTKLLLICHQALESLRTGTATVDDMGNLEMLAMLTTVLAAAGIGKEYQEIGEQARVTVSQIVARGIARGGQYRLAGHDLEDMAQCLELHEQQLQHEDTTKEVLVAATNRSVAELRAQAERYHNNS